MKIATREDWNIKEMPNKIESFILNRAFSGDQIAALRRGNIPQEMEDKWFWFMEGDTLYAHRSWTGICVYIIEFSFLDNHHKVMVNRDPKQYGGDNVEEDRKSLNRLLDWWTQADYDHYGEWITETVEMLKKSGQIPKDAEDYRREGLELEQQGKLEEAFVKYEEAAKMDDAPSMICIARMYLSGEFRPVEGSNLAQLLLQGGPIFPWSMRKEKQPDYKSGMEWLTKAADLGNALACETLGNMLCSGIGCKVDLDRGIGYLEKAVSLGKESAGKYIHLYRPDGKVLTDEAYEACLAEFIKAAEAGEDRAYELYATLKSGTQKQLARLGYVLIAAQNVQRTGFEPFKYSVAPSGIPFLPVASKRLSWRTFLRFNLDAWADKHPLIAVSSDILDVREPSCMLKVLHRGTIIGTAIYRSPAFGWLGEEKKAILIRLGEGEDLSAKAINGVASSFGLIDEEYMGDNIAFMVENGEKEYSFEVAGINGEKVDVLWRYTIGGSDRVHEYFEPKLIDIERNG